MDKMASYTSMEFRTAMGSFLSGVTVVTTQKSDGSPTGAAVNAFSSISSSPATLMVSLDHNSRTLGFIKESKVFGVNILAKNQLDIVRHFASKIDNPFGATPHQIMASGAPIIEGSLAWFECSIADIFKSGDHDIIIGHITSLYSNPELSPLGYFRGELLTTV
ncbi:flavin reductase family protein [Hirschia baltica]|uniref:Flavin reductase domain protein FMN-binding n=1 Tax=Hirschia baltica (strain ATCC 49814 / DSM 5838 / IFAM 1418) TaxID=582402 RepID=C6XP35_HIRBI|nr:flavin reductase family protein [Hirschia baltica]ACT60215.1 flavin reductase domain protein FMN-binding [Hirschia baltica ATCC 49814]